MHRTNIVLTLGILAALLMCSEALAHCDGMDGPVVKAAQQALNTGNVNLVLIWVQKSDEPEVRRAFERALAVRKLDEVARELADLYFFETLVRIHRAGEGAPYTGLKSAGRDLGPAIPAADKAIATGSASPLLELLTHEVQHGIEARFKRVLAAKGHSQDNIVAGREFVKAYVAFVHYVEGIHQASITQAEGHFEEEMTKTQHGH